MTTIAADRIASTYFACGLVKEPAAPAIREKLRLLDDRVQTVSLAGYGHFFYTTPAYADVAEADDMVWIKLGHVHDGERMLSTEAMIQRGWLRHDDVKAEAIKGSATLIGFNKREPVCLIYRNLMSPAAVYYWNRDGVLLATDNLRLMIELLPDPQLNEDVLAQHLIYRAVYGRQTYVRHVAELWVGEQLRWQDGAVSVDLRRDLRDMADSSARKPVNAATVAEFYEQFKRVMGIYLAGHTDRAATMLSGGVDSTLMQVAINAHPNIDGAFPSFSFAVETPSFDLERGYAQAAASTLGTKHTFAPITPQAHVDWLQQSIAILGQPVSFDAPPNFLALADFIASHHSQFDRLFHGQIADGLHGVQESLGLVQGDKYRHWPVPLLQLLGIALMPLSKPKSYGARKAAETLETFADSHSPANPLNAVGLRTDWDTLNRCFSRSVIDDALAAKRSLEQHYLESNVIVEKTNALDLLTDGIEPATKARQLGLFCGPEYIFPFADEAIVQATFGFDPIDRYTFGHRVKPILKLALESQILTDMTSATKGYSSIFYQSIVGWMRDGVLCEMVQAIERPAFMTRTDFERKLAQPDWFTWNLLTLDLFKRYVLA